MPTKTTEELKEEYQHLPSAERAFLAGLFLGLNGFSLHDDKLNAMRAGARADQVEAHGRWNHGIVEMMKMLSCCDEPTCSSTTINMFKTNFFRHELERAGKKNAQRKRND